MRRALRLVSRSRLRPGQRALDPSPPLSDRTSPRRPRAPRIAVGGLGLRFGRGLIAAALECRRHRPWRARGGEGEERQDKHLAVQLMLIPMFFRTFPALGTRAAVVHTTDARTTTNSWSAAAVSVACDPHPYQRLE